MPHAAPPDARSLNADVARPSSGSESALEVRLAAAEDVPGIIDLMKGSLGEGSIPRSEAFWAWKHIESPFGASPALLAVEPGGRIVGLRVFMRWRWRAAGRELEAARAVDTATHPDWRGRGIFSRLTLALAERMREDGVAFVFNTPNEKSRPGYLKMGWTSLGRTSLWMAPLRPVRLLRQGLALARGRVAAGPATPVPGARRFPDFAAFLADATSGELLASLADDGRLHTPLTAAYLRWRYAAIPGFTYYARWGAGRGGAAAAIFRLKAHGPLTEVRFCELMVAPSGASRAIARDLVREILRESGADYAAAAAGAGTLEGSVLATSGFLPAPRVGPILTVRPLADAVAPDPLHRGSWRPSIGALELF